MDAFFVFVFVLSCGGWGKIDINLLTTGNPFLGTKLLEFSIGRGSGALKGLSSPHLHVFSCMSCVNLSQWYSQSSASWRFWVGHDPSKV